MATRSTIALEFSDGTIGQVYCHFDGYISNNGQLLQNHWLDPEKVSELIKLGNMSCLGKVVGNKHEFNNPYSWGTFEYNEWKSKWSDACTFYGRDRGEDDVDANYFENWKEYLDKCPHEEFNYILRYIDGEYKWLVSSYKYDHRFILLTKAFEAEEEDPE